MDVALSMQTFINLKRLYRSCCAWSLYHKMWLSVRQRCWFFFYILIATVDSIPVILTWGKMFIFDKNWIYSSLYNYIYRSLALAHWSYVLRVRREEVLGSDQNPAGCLVVFGTRNCEIWHPICCYVFSKNTVNWWPIFGCWTLTFYEVFKPNLGTAPRTTRLWETGSVMCTDQKMCRRVCRFSLLAAWLPGAHAYWSASVSGILVCKPITSLEPRLPGAHAHWSESVSGVLVCKPITSLEFRCGILGSASCVTCSLIGWKKVKQPIRKHVSLGLSGLVLRGTSGLWGRR